jgi:predicted nucleic acid-binding protein
MQVFDASSMLYAWDNYPVAQFPGLWAWMANRMAQGMIRMSVVAVEEVGHKAPECVSWLTEAGIEKLPVTEAILLESLRIKGLLDIEEDRYGGGIDENDLLIIATAKLHELELVTDEAFQAKLPKLKHNYKIPAVCNFDTVGVEWVGFLGYLKRSGAVFG